jgi:zinc transporter ZupT
MPGLVAMSSVFVVVGIEMFFASKGAGHVHSTDYEAMGIDEGPLLKPGHKRSNSFGRFRANSLGINGHPPDIVLHDMEQSSENLIAERSPSAVASSSPRANSAPRQSSTKYDEDDEDLDLGLDELGLPDAYDSEDSSRLLSNPRARKNSHPNLHDQQNHSSHSTDPSQNLTEAQHQKQLLQCLLLEAGILFHSVFIGMALSVATGTSFLVLLVAISFHQTFEGLALGSRIAAIRFPPNSPKPWLMALAYGTTTPIGQAIGLLIHNLYDPASQTGLLTVGVMNAISSGLLLFAGLVELLAEDFLSDESYQILRGRKRLEACASVVGGAALMALVGAWA